MSAIIQNEPSIFATFSKGETVIYVGPFGKDHTEVTITRRGRKNGLDIYFHNLEGWGYPDHFIHKA